MESFLKDINEIEDLSKTGPEFPYRKELTETLPVEQQIGDSGVKVFGS